MICDVLVLQTCHMVTVEEHVDGVSHDMWSIQECSSDRLTPLLRAHGEELLLKPSWNTLTVTEDNPSTYKFKNYSG